MPKYTNIHGKINLDDYKNVKEFKTGNTNQVSLWEHKQDSHCKIVVKIPNEANSDLVQHNIFSINAFFGEDSAWLIAGNIQGQEGFAMKYYDGMSLSSEEEKQLINKNDSPLETISKNGLLFTMLDLNKDNFLKLPNDQVIPIDFDYMLVHGTKLLPYQEQYLNQRQGFLSRTNDISDEKATQYVLDSYPSAAPYLYEQWGNKYLKTNKYNQTSNVILKPVIDKLETLPVRVPSSIEKNYNENIDLLIQKISNFKNKPQCQNAFKAANILHDALKTEGEKYFSGELSKARYVEFKENCKGFIKTASLELEKHRGFTKIFLNILAIIISAGIGYTLAAGINIALNRGKFTFFSTDSSIKINSIEKSINQAAPALLKAEALAL